MPSCKFHSVSFSTPLIMKNKQLASPSHLSCSSNVVDLMCFDSSEAEQPQSPKHVDTETSDKASQINFKTIDQSSTNVMGESVNVGKSVVGESIDPVNADKSERGDEAQEERSVDEDSEKPDETQGGHADGDKVDESVTKSGLDEMLEETKTDEEGENEESGATHEMTEKVLKEGEIDKTARSKEQLEEVQQEEERQEIESEEQPVEMPEGEPSHDLKTSAQSEELKDEVSKTEIVTQLDEDPSAVSNEDLEACTNTDLNIAEDIDVTDNLLEALESKFTVPQDKKHIWKSKTEARKPHKVHL